MPTWSDSICENTFETSHVRFIHENFSVLITTPLDIYYYYTAWSNSTKFVEKRDLPTHGQTCGHRFADVIWRIPNPTLRFSSAKIVVFVSFTGAFTSQYLVKPVKETCKTVHSIPKETCQKVTRFDEPYKTACFWVVNETSKDGMHMIYGCANLWSISMSFLWVTCDAARGLQICGVLPCLSYELLATLQGACSVCVALFY